jgi:hypothetical protein
MADNRDRPPRSAAAKRMMESDVWRDPELAEDRALERTIRRMRLGLRLGDPDRADKFVSTEDTLILSVIGSQGNDQGG